MILNSTTFGGNRTKMWKLVRTDGQTDTQTDRQADSYIPPKNMFAGGIIWSKHLLPIFYLFFGRSCSRSNNTALRVASGVNMNTLSQIYISQSEIVSTLQNNQSENAFYVSSVLCRKAWQPACDFFDSASTDILPCPEVIRLGLGPLRPVLIVCFLSFTVHIHLA